MNWEKYGKEIFYPNIQNITNYENFEMKLNNMSDNKYKGDCFELFCKYYFKLTGLYEIKNFFLFSEIPDRIKQIAENLPNTDKGIDAIIEWTDGKISAVQCKFRSNIDKIIKWEELSTFAGLTFGVVDGFKNGIFFTNCLDVNEQLKNTKYINITRNDLVEKCDKKFWNDCRNYIKDHTIEIKQEKINPKQYQKNIISLANEYYGKNKNGRLYMPCGSGKTLLGFWINTNLNCGKTFIAVPSLYLASTTYEVWKLQMNAHNKHIKFLIIASDIDTELDYDVNQNDHKQHKISCNYEITTKEQDITDFLNKNKNAKIVVITTYQSSELLINCCYKIDFIFDFGIFDEAHRTVGIEGKKFTKLVTANITKKRLFMTATEKIFKKYNRKNSKECFEDENEEIISMNDDNIYGKVIHSYSTRQAITDDVLCDYKILALSVPEENISYLKNKIGKNKLKYVTINEMEIQETHLIIACMVIQAIKYNGCCHILIFSNFNRTAKIIYNTIKIVINETKMDSKDIFIGCLSGSDNMAKRRSAVKQFENARIGIISSAKIFNEGVDIKSCDAVLFADIKNSIIDIVQCIGRCLRKFIKQPNKIGHILIPLIFSSSNEREFFDEENGSFIRIRKILKAMGTTDNQVRDTFKIIRCKNIAKDKLNDESKEGKIDTFICGTKIDITEFTENFKIKVFNRNGIATLYDEFKKLKKYVIDQKIKNKCEYNKQCKIDQKMIMMPDSKYDKYWKGWYDFLGINPEQFIKDKHMWKEKCNKLNITTLEQYYLKCSENIDLPEMPEEIYKDFGSIISEIGVIKPRRK